MWKNNWRSRLVVLACMLVAEQSLAQVLLTVAGGYTGDGGPATEAIIIAPQDGTTDGAGNVYVAEGKRIRRIDPSGTITTLMEAADKVYSIHVDGEDNLYFTAGGQVHKRSSSGVVTTVAGSQTYNEDNENVPATAAYFGDSNVALSIAVDDAGNIYITHSWLRRVWKVDAESGILTTVAGNGESADSGDGGLATEAQFMTTSDVVVDGEGNLYIVDEQAHRVRKVDAATGIITTVAGTGSYGFGEGVATEVGLADPRALFLTSAGELVIGGQREVRRVDTAGNMTVVAGSQHGGSGFSGDGGPAREATFNDPRAVWVDGSGNLYIADTGNSRVRKVDTAGIINTLAGGTFGDGELAGEASLNAPMDVALDAVGNLYIADTENHRIRRVDAATGIITTVAGGGAADWPDFGDGGLATDAQLQSPHGVFVDREGNLFIADTNGGRIRKVDTSGTITTVAGGAEWNDPLGDGGQATEAKLESPRAVYVLDDGTIYIAARTRIRQVDPSGTITTAAGDGTWNASGDGGLAIDAGVPNPQGIFVDASGNVYITSNNAVRKIDTAGSISTLVGNLEAAAGIHGDAEGNLYVSQPATWSDEQTVVRVNPSGEVETLIGGLDNPQGLFYDQANGVLYVAETGGGRIGKVGSGSKIVLDRNAVGLGYLSPTGAMIERLGVSNEGNRPLEAVLSLEGDGAFSLSSAELVLAPEVSDGVEITFDPPGEGDFAATLRIESNDPENGTVTIPIMGKRTDVPRIDLNQRDMDFGRLLIQHEAVEGRVIRNRGFLPLELVLSLEGDDTFSLLSEEATLGPGDSERVQISFLPPGEGDYSGTLKISSNDPANEELTIALTGIGVLGKVVTDEWTSIKPGEVEYISIAMDRKTGRLFLIGGEDSATFRSSDGGDSWEKLGRLPRFGDFIVVDPEDSQRIYAAAENWEIFSWSEDGGRTWQDMEIGFAISRDLKATLSDGEVTLYVTGRAEAETRYQLNSLYRSTDRGQTWNRVLTLDSSSKETVLDTVKIIDAAVDPLNPEKLYIGTMDGLFVTQDGGESWVQLDNMITEKVAVGGGKIYSKRSGQLFRSDNQGRAWENLNEVLVERITVNPVNPDIVYMSRAQEPGGHDLEMFRSVDGGQNWEQVPTDFNYNEPPVLLLDPVDPSIVYYIKRQELLKRDFDDPEYQPPVDIEEPLEISRDPRRAIFWKLHRIVNLGPKGGNGALGNSIAVEQGGDRIFTGNQRNMSVVERGLSLVSGVIGYEQLGAERALFEITIAINESRGELYLLDGLHPRVLVLDLKDLDVMRDIALRGEGIVAGEDLIGNSRVWSYPRPMVVDEENERLYVGNANSVSVIDLRSAEVVGNVFLTGDIVHDSQVFKEAYQAINDLALDREHQRLYAANSINGLVEVIDLENLQVVDRIECGVSPLQLALDPQQAFLYVVAIELRTERAGQDIESSALRIDLNAGVVDRRLDLPTDPEPANETPRLVLASAARELIVSLSSYYLGPGGARTLLQGFSEPSKRFVIDLDGFQIEEEGHWSSMVQALRLDEEREEVLWVDVANLLHRTDIRDGTEKTTIQIGADPQGIAVSQKLNQVYISRGLQGGFYVLDAEGTIIRSIVGPPSSEIVIDDLADRLFVHEGKGMMGVYELSSLRRLNTAEVGMEQDLLSILSMRADHKRGVMWLLNNGSELGKLDLFTGATLKRIHLFELYREMYNETVYFDQIAVDPDRDRAYLSNPGHGERVTVGVFDLEQEKFIDTIDISAPFEGVDFSTWFMIPSLELDRQNQLLYIWGRSDDGADVKLDFIVTVDLATKEIIDTFDLGAGETLRADGAWHGSPGVIVDVRRRLAYAISGHIADLDARGGGESFTGAFAEPTGDHFVMNHLTNAIYMLVGSRQVTDEGMYIYLGPAGTEVSAPPAPEDVVATPGDEEVILSWPAVDDSTLVGYHLYRKDRVDSDFSRITRLPLRDTTFTDLDLTNSQTYTYQVSSVGEGALESIVPSDPVSATPTGGGNFQLLVLRKSVSVAREDSVSLPMSIESLEGFDKEVTLSTQVPEGLEVVFDPAQFVPPKIVEVKVRAATDVAVGRFEIELQGEGGDKLNTAQIVVEVTEKVLEQSVLTLELDQEEVPLDIPLSVSGRLFPGSSTQVQLDFRAERADTLIILTVDTDREGGYGVEFLAPFTDKWNVEASWVGNADFEATQSRTVEFAVTSGKSRITATSDLAEDADLGFIATLKGRIYPNPGTVGITLNVRRPDGAQEKIEGVLSSSEGFYGHDLKMNQKGMWEIWASWKGNNKLLGAVSPVITVPVAADVGRVILLTCGRDAARDIFWPTANYLGNLAYTTFQRRRLLKEKVFYLNDRQEQDVDRDGFMEDVDGGATLADLSAAWDWARERVNVDNPLYVYVVGKGTPAGLEVSQGEILRGSQLAQELNQLEEETGASATVIVEASHAGNFIRDLSEQGRPVIASTGPGLAYYQAEGYLSFSQYFFTDLFQGKSLQEAFLHTDQILRNLPGGFRQQDPGLEAEGNVIPNQPGDYLQTIDAIIGAPFELGDLAPQIKAGSLSAATGGAGKRVVTQTAPVSEDPGGPRLKLAQSEALQGVEISTRIDDPEGSLKVVRAMIIPPESDSLSSLTAYPEVELHADGQGQWVGVYNEFLEEGVYPVIIYAIDGAGNAAEPLRTTVLVEPEPPAPTGDFNADGLVDFADFFMFADAFGGDDPAYDLDGSGMVDFGDFFLFADAFGGPLGKLLALAEEMLHLPTEYALGAPYPNPFNSEVVVKYTLPVEGEVELVVYNALGQVVRRLATGHQRLGHHRAVWDGRDERGRGLATGTYLVQLRAGEYRQVRKIAFVK